MNTIDLEDLGKNFQEHYDKPTLLFEDGPHAVYWLGWPEDTAFRCNTYMVVDGREAFIIDPGGAGAFEFVLKRVSQIIPPETVTGLILSHQDPDVAASMVDWLALNPDLKIVTSTRANVLIVHYGQPDYHNLNINDDPFYHFSSGRKLKFIEAPFLHFPGAFTTYDESSGFLLSGDIWAAIDMDWRLMVEDFKIHEMKMNLFHIDYMAGNIAARGYIQRLKPFQINAILPQHGSIITSKFVPQALRYLEKLRCGLDIIYPDLR